MSCETGCGHWHLFLTRIPVRLPKEEVEAALAKELLERDVQAEHISIVPQSSWKNKGYGFVALVGSPSAEQLLEVAAKLDNELRVGGKQVSVRVCTPSSGLKPSPPELQTCSWDQPTEKTSRLCAQVLHTYFARRSHQAAFKAEKLLALLSMTIAPSCSQEAKALSLWGRGVFGSLEKMLLAIGESHFGGGWTLTGSIAERNAVLCIGNERHMQGWDPVHDPLPVTTLLRLAACKQRLEGAVHAGGHSGLSTPSMCRRVSDCGSLSVMHSADQPSCSESDAGSWSMCSLLLQNSDASTPCRGSGNFPSTSSTPPASASFRSLQSRSDVEHHRHQRDLQPDPPDPGVGTSRPAPASDGRNSPGRPGCCGRRSARGPAEGAPGAQIAGWPQRPPSAWPQHGNAPAQLGPNHHLQAPHQQHPRTQAPHMPPPLPRLRDGGDRGRAMGHAPCWGPAHHPSTSPPSAKDILARCAKHLELLFSYYPRQCAFPLPYVADFLSAAQDIVAWGSGSPHFSLGGYAAAVYGSFERFLAGVSRLYFGGGWRFEGGGGRGGAAGEPRVLCVPPGASRTARLPGQGQATAYTGQAHGSGPATPGVVTATPVAVPILAVPSPAGSPSSVAVVVVGSSGIPAGSPLPVAVAVPLAAPMAVPLAAPTPSAIPVAVPVPRAVSIADGASAAAGVAGDNERQALPQKQQRRSGAFGAPVSHRPRSEHSASAAGMG